MIIYYAEYADGSVTAHRRTNITMPIIPLKNEVLYRAHRIWKHDVENDTVVLLKDRLHTEFNHKEFFLIQLKAVHEKDVQILA